MKLFGKHKITEEEISNQFVLQTLELVKDNFSSTITPKLKEAFGDSFNGDIETKSLYEFYIALLFFDMLAIPNTFTKEQTTRINQYIFTLLKIVSEEVGLGDYPVECIKEYQTTWNNVLAQGKIPTNIIATMLCEKMGFIFDGDNSHQFFTLHNALVLFLPSYSDGWWKKANKRYKIIE